MNLKLEYWFFRKNLALKVGRVACALDGRHLNDVKRKHIRGFCLEKLHCVRCGREEKIWRDAEFAKKPPLPAMVQRYEKEYDTKQGGNT